jgi:hypothetical protein
VFNDLHLALNNIQFVVPPVPVFRRAHVEDDATERSSRWTVVLLPSSGTIVLFSSSWARIKILLKSNSRVANRVT